MIPTIDMTQGVARAWTQNGKLILTTGRVRRIWEWTDAGLATNEVALEGNGRSWKPPQANCDWQLPPGAPTAGAKLVQLTAQVANDEGFTSEHLEVSAEIDYPSQGFTLKWRAWAYPNAPGLRTQIFIRRTAKPNPTSVPAVQGGWDNVRVELVPIGKTPGRRRYFGYHNETQQRNDTHQDLLKEEVVTHPLSYREWCGWASAACVEDEAGGIALVKESHKCVNQAGHVGGEFVCDPTTGLACTGQGVRPQDIETDRFTPCWATWMIAWAGGDVERQLAFKRFDHLRYPIDPARDIYIQANTWGSTDNGSDARRAAAEPSVLKEIEVCAEMGIDFLQIDDGWQTPLGAGNWPPGEHGWRPHPQCYPQGWKNIRALAAKLGVRLGLWAAAQPITLDELKATYTQGGFLQYKLDFAALKNRAEIQALMEKVRAFITWTGHRVRVNWDVTENAARYGYFFAREYGPLYLENRKPVRPRGVVYRPHTVLRDLWQAAKYLNLHRIQGSIQNIDTVDPDYSDAHLHTHGYVTAIALMSIPLFFCEMKYYSAAAKAQIAPLLKAYKRHRADIYRGIVHPVGHKPDNAGWTGFQCHLEEENRGYLTVFRERCNPDARFDLPLARPARPTLRLIDLVTGRQWDQPVNPDGTLALSIPDAPGFLFLQYA